MKWFENIKKDTFKIYKKGILEQPLLPYKYIQLRWTGQGFGLGLSETPKNKSWEYLPFDGWDNSEWSIESTYRTVENIPDEEYDKEDDCYYEVELQRDEWPYDSSDCFALEYFLIATILGLTFLELKQDKALSGHLSKIEVIDIYSVDREINSFGYYFPKPNIRNNIIDLLIKDTNHQQLILDLWEDELKNVGKEFLQNFGKQISQTPPIALETFRKTFQKSEDLYKNDQEQKAIDLLEPLLEQLINQDKKENIQLIEKSCSLLGDCYRYIKNKNYDKSISWYQKGITYIPYSNCALKILNTYKTELHDFEALVAFGEQHLENATKNGKEYTFHSYNYLAYGYIQLDNEVKAKELYKKLYKLFDRDVEKIQKVRAELEKIQDSNAIAQDVLKWFNAR